MRLWVEPRVLDEIAALPGHMRQRIRRAVNDLRENPRPFKSRVMQIPSDIVVEAIEARRLRLDQWWVVYVIDPLWESIIILAVRKRPPYNYDDLRELLERL